MCASDVRFRSCDAFAWVLVLALVAACGDDGAQGVSVRRQPDAGADADEDTMTMLTSPCDDVRIDGDLVEEHEKDFTARFRMGEPYEKTVMLFGGERVEDENKLSNAYIFALDKTDALMLAEKYDDFYLCSSPGGMEASSYIVPYDLVPATCEIYEQLVAALRQYSINLAAGGDRTSLRFEGAPLELESVTEDATGEDVTDQITDQDFQLVTAVEQLSGESVINFGTTP